MRLVPRTPAAPEPAGPQRELVALHQRIYRRQSALIKEILGPESTEFRRYRRRYELDAQSFQAVVPYDEVVRAAARASLILMGDYHTLRHAQRATLKLAERLLAEGVRLSLALEFIQGRYQEAVDDYLAGKLDEAAFLSVTNYRRLQPFDLWPNFKPFFDLARREQLPLYAIDSPAGGPGSLAARDRYAARVLAVALRAQPERVPLALMGQLHLAHLPAALPSWVREETLVVYQNCEPLYFELARRGEEQTAEAVRLRERVYSVINSSPLVAQQSYLDWVEATALGERLEAVAPEVHFRAAARLVSEFLGIVPPRPFEEVEVASPENLSLFRRLQRENVLSSRRSFRLLARRASAGESFCLPREHAVYLAGSSLNRAAEVAAQYLWHLCADEDGDTRGLVDAFYAASLEQALGFFGSKVVNPRRKAQHEPQLRARLEREETPPREREIAEAVLLHHRFERGGLAPEVQQLYSLRAPELFHGITRALGQALGDKLYYALLRGQIGKDEVRSLFFDPFDDEGAALHTYLYLAGKVRRTRVPQRKA